jgi:exodeoxyribonuclease VII large subunit
VEAIAVIRGGGSLEDLWAFNEEPLVRAVAAAPVPVVSGVGHETDVSLCDLVADVRALTPTDAAVRMSPDRSALLTHLTTVPPRLAGLVNRRLAEARDRLVRLATSRALTRPERLVTGRRDVVRERAARLERLVDGVLRRAGERLAATAGRIEAASPLQILARGYAVTMRADGADTGPLRDVAGLRPGARLVTRLARGRVWSIVEATDEAVETGAPVGFPETSAVPRRRPATDRGASDRGPTGDTLR